MTNDRIHVSVIPSYHCNYQCEYCYLGDFTLNSALLDLNILKQRLNELSVVRQISELVVYGGEVSLLPIEYVDQMCCVLNQFCKPSFVTNLSNDWIVDYADRHDYSLSISLNKERPFYNDTIVKIKKLKRLDNKSISSVVTPSILNSDIDELIGTYNEFGMDVLFIEYHPSIYSHVKYDITLDDFSNFLIRIITNSNRRFSVVNESIIRQVDWNPCKSGFIFINPNGKYCSVGYRNGIEYPIEYDSLDEWTNDCELEYIEYFNNCSLCEYFNKCKAEHLVEMKHKECSGLYNVMKSVNYPHPKG